MGTILIRTVILYFFVIIGLRLMGKRQIGDLEPSELVVTMMISELAAIPMQEVGVPLFSGIAPILVLIFLEVLLSYLSLKSKKFRRISVGKPTIIIYNGHIDKEQLEYLRITRSDVMEQLRINNCFNIQDVEYGIMEKDGQISIKLKKGKNTVTKDDLNGGVK